MAINKNVRFRWTYIEQMQSDRKLAHAGPKCVGKCKWVASPSKCHRENSGQTLMRNKQRTHFAGAHTHDVQFLVHTNCKGKQSPPAEATVTHTRLHTSTHTHTHYNDWRRERVGLVFWGTETQHDTCLCKARGQKDEGVLLLLIHHEQLQCRAATQSSSSSYKFLSFKPIDQLLIS